MAHWAAATWQPRLSAFQNDGVFFRRPLLTIWTSSYVNKTVMEAYEMCMFVVCIYSYVFLVIHLDMSQKEQKKRTAFRICGFSFLFSCQ